MIRGWRYRLVAGTGVAVITATVLAVVNLPVVQVPATELIPLLWRLEPRSLSGSALWLAMATSVAVVVAGLYPAFKPRPWRILNLTAYTQKRVLLAGVGLAALGYYNYTFRLPRTTLSLLVATLLVVLPAWFVGIRVREDSTTEQAIIIGDSPSQIERIHTDSELSIVGYLSPPAATMETASTPSEQTGTAATPDGVAVADGGANISNLSRLGGLSQLESILVDNDVTTVCLAFGMADRCDFFGTLDTCHTHGVDVKVHREYSDDVLTASSDVETLVDVDVEPWDPQDYVLKRLFDVAFAGFGLLVLSPVIGAIALAIKLDSPGPVLYSQDRTAGFGATFSVYKFRSMIPDAEAESGAKISEDDNGGVDPRVTRVGRFLRKTHMDEIPQLWSILVGDMSVVGPRPERPTIDSDIQNDGVNWCKRWFIKPGLTGLAQINEVTGHEPSKKLRYDVKYIRDQSFTTDVLIVTRQIWMVVVDFTTVLQGDDPDASEADE